jgi:hypothetical protein
MSRNPFESAQSRIRWAKDDIKHFKKRSDIYVKKNPYSRVIETDPKGREVHKVKLVTPMPDALNSRVVKASEGLRAALDLAATAVASANGAPTGTKTHFPFCAKESDLKSRLNSACKFIPDDIKKLFAAYKPYQGGDDMLWVLNELANSSKHTIVEPIGIHVGSAQINEVTMQSGNLGGYVAVPRWDRTKNEMVLGACSPGSKFDYKVKFLFTIAFGDVPIVASQPVDGVLDALAGKVQQIVDATAEVYRRLGLSSKFHP